VFGLKTSQALESALLLAAGGEFAFVILGTAMDHAIVGSSAGRLLLVSVTVSMFCIPLLAGIGARLGGRLAKTTLPVAPAVESKEAARVLVVGHGRVGRLVGEMLSVHEIPWVAAERDARAVEAARRAGDYVYYGDASRPEFLLRCGLETARALIVTMDSPEGAEAVVAAVRELRPDLTIVARARDARHARRLYDLGATDAVPETIEASLQLSEAALVEIGVPMGLVIASIHERRDAYRTELNRPDALGGRRRRLRDPR
jgi:CPA2 family monovalent cation:H+ antiporter-2